MTARPQADPPRRAFPRRQQHDGLERPGGRAATSSSSSFPHFAQTAERAKFDFLFLAEGLRLREQGGRIYDLDVVGRPDNFSILTALAAVTDRLGLAGTVNSTFNEPLRRRPPARHPRPPLRRPRGLERRHLAGTRSPARTSAAAATCRRTSATCAPRSSSPPRSALFDSWAADEVVADQRPGGSCGDGDAGRFAIRADQFDIAGRFTVPRSPQGRPVIIQAGDSEEGREFAACERRRDLHPARRRWRPGRRSTPT